QSKALTSQDKIVGGVRSVSFDDDTGNYLFNSDVSNAITESMGKRHIAILGFDACLMSMIETAYQLQDVADVMIASEELEPGTGWNYTTLLGALNGPQASPLSVAKALETAYATENRDDYATLAPVNLSGVKPLANSGS